MFLANIKVTKRTQTTFYTLDSVVLKIMIGTRASVMRPPNSCEDTNPQSVVLECEARKSRVWKLFVSFPIMLLFKPPRGEDQNGGEVDSPVVAVQAVEQRRRRVSLNASGGNVEDEFHPMPKNVEPNGQALLNDPLAPNNEAWRDPRPRNKHHGAQWYPKLTGYQPTSTRQVVVEVRNAVPPPVLWVRRFFLSRNHGAPWIVRFGLHWMTRRSQVTTSSGVSVITDLLSSDGLTIFAQSSLASQEGFSNRLANEHVMLP